MQCPACGAENPDAANFCGGCGQNLGHKFDRPAGPVSLSAPPDSQSEPPDRAASANRLHLPAEPDDSGGEALPGSPALAAQTPAQVAQRTPYPPPPLPLAPPPGALPLPQPPPAPLPQGYGAPYAYQDFQDGNTSGMGPGYPLPPEAKGWSFAGCVPYGIFCFVHNSVLWGLLSLLIPVVGLIFVGIQGRQLAWENRRFTSIEQFQETMRAWNTAGLVFLVLSALLMVFYVVFMAFMMVAAMNKTGSGY